jgi:apolipoprotein N-acyltransferase
VVVAAILAQTLFFKFTGAEESVYIFSTLGAEPWGRFGTAILELVAVVLLLTPRTAAVGALLTVALMLGAVGAHLTGLGIEVLGDGGLLFALALVNLAGAVAITLFRRRQLPVIGTNP